MAKNASKCAHVKDCVLLKAQLIWECSAACQYFKKAGKVFSKVDQGQRVPSDQYQTPYSMIDQFLDVKLFDATGKFLEPAKGQGSIVKVLRKNGYRKVTSYDIEQTPPEVSLENSKYNFLNEKREFDYIITNPPYKAATDFIKKAATICRYNFAFLMPLNYLHGQARHDEIFKNKSFPFGLEKLWVFTRMPMLGVELREDGKYNTGMQVYAWYLFSKGCQKATVIDWIDNNKYVLRGETWKQEKR